MKKIKLLVAAFSLLMAACPMAKAQSISGAGATFPQPFYNTAFMTSTTICVGR